MTAVMLRPPDRLVDVTVDGAAMRLPEGMMLAAALACAGVLLLRRSPRENAPRGAFCFMGACQECAIRVDGALRQACMIPVSPGMAVKLADAAS
jgi:sarcosine oxidase subunit alpha